MSEIPKEESGDLPPEEQAPVGDSLDSLEGAPEVEKEFDFDAAQQEVERVRLEKERKLEDLAKEVFGEDDTFEVMDHWYKAQEKFDKGSTGEKMHELAIAIKLKMRKIARESEDAFAANIKRRDDLKIEKAKSVIDSM